MNLAFGHIMKAIEQIISLAATSGWEDRVIGFVPLLKQYGGLVLFMSTLLEHLGLPLPAIPGLLTAGALARTGKMSLSLVFGSPSIGSLLANAVWYALGRSCRQQALTWFCRFSGEPNSTLMRMGDLLSRYRIPSLLLSKFLPGVGAVVQPLAAVTGMRTLPFLAINILGTFLYTGVYVGMGYFFSDQLGPVAHSLVNLGHLTFIAIVAVTSISVLYWPKLRLMR